MSRMLFLRDIQVDIQMRCRGCGHEGVLARPDLERRFGPNYPVLSIAPHYRCSRCNSKDVESGPAPNASASFAATPTQPEDFGGAMGALQGLLQAVRGESQPRDDVRELMDDDLLDTMVEDPGDEAEADGEAPYTPYAAPPPPPEKARREPDLDEFDELFAKLVPARSYEEEEEEEEEEDEDDEEFADEPPPPPPPAPAPADSPFDETLAALRALTSAPDAEHEEGDWEAAGAPLYDETAEALDDTPEEDRPEEDRPVEDFPEEDLPKEDLPDEDLLEEDLLEEDLDDIPDEEILSFAIRDPDARRAPEPVLDDALLDARADEDADDDEEDGEPLDLASYRRPPPEPGSLDESLAALRALVERAAAEEPEPEPKPRKKTPKPAGIEPAPIEPAPVEPIAVEPAPIEDDPAEEPPPPLKTAQEKSLEETLAQLRGMLDLDKDAGEEGEPVIKPRRR